MPRIPVVTRQLTITKVEVMCLDIVKQEPFTKEIILPRKQRSEAQVLKAVRKIIDNGNEKAVHIVSMTTETNHYRMTEAKFIEHAEIVKPTKN